MSPTTYLHCDQEEPTSVGRINPSRMSPLSLEELARQSSWIEVKRRINDLMVYGCLPEVIAEPSRAREYLRDLADTLLYKDLLELAEIRKPADLTKLTRFLAANVGSVIRCGSAARELGMQNKTIERYVDLLARCSIITIVPSWSSNPAVELKSSRKIYFCDNGIRNAILNNFTLLPTRKDKEALWENLFLSERRKRHAMRRDGAEMYFWRTRRQHEIDLIEVVNGTIAAFECSSGRKTGSTCLKAFRRAYPNIPLTVASPDNIDQEPAEPVSRETVLPIIE